MPGGTARSTEPAHPNGEGVGRAACGFDVLCVPDYLFPQRPRELVLDG
jgi:hypothetical protein